MTTSKKVKQQNFVCRPGSHRINLPSTTNSPLTLSISKAYLYYTFFICKLISKILWGSILNPSKHLPCNFQMVQLYLQAIQISISRTKKLDFNSKIFCILRTFCNIHLQCLGTHPSICVGYINYAPLRFVFSKVSYAFRALDREICQIYPVKVLNDTLGLNG